MEEESEKENENLNIQVHQDTLMEAVEKEGIIVYKKFDEDQRNVALTNGEAAYFALLASDMLELADKYKRDIDEIHKIFFEVSCDREKLIKILEG